MQYIKRSIEKAFSFASYFDSLIEEEERMSPAPCPLAFLLAFLLFVGLSSGLPLLLARCNLARKTIQCAAVAVVVSTSLLGLRWVR